MPRKKNITFWACDFETTVWGEKVEQEKGKKQDSTEVWSCADVALYDETESVTITHSIRDFLNRFLKQLISTSWTVLYAQPTLYQKQIPFFL